MADFRVSFRYKSILSVFSLHLMHFQIVLPIDGDLGFLVDGRVFYLSSWSLASFDAFLWFFPFYFIHRNGIRLRSVLYVLLEIIRSSGDFLFFLVICRSDVAIWFFVSILVKKKKWCLGDLHLSFCGLEFRISAKFVFCCDFHFVCLDYYYYYYFL